MTTTTAELVDTPHWQGVVQYAHTKYEPRSWTCGHNHRGRESAMQCAIRTVRRITKTGEEPLSEFTAYTRYLD